jgi:hypothetical protein
MSTVLKKKLQGTDRQIGDAADFLQLSAEETDRKFNLMRLSIARV